MYEGLGVQLVFEELQYLTYGRSFPRTKRNFIIAFGKAVRHGKEMQSSDNIRYLNTDPFGSYSLSGSIFLDCRNAADFSDPYSLVYGHHMEHGRMFGALDDFLSEAYLKQHSKGTLMIGKKAEKTYSLEVFAAMRANAANKTIFNLSDPDALRTELKTRAAVYTEDKDARILGLSTCAEGDAVSRILVFCYLTES